MVESIARVRHIRITPQKARRVVDLIRGKNVQEALAILKFAPQAASEPIYKLVASAIALWLGAVLASRQHALQEPQ